jgi:hypothetical protein
MRGSAIGRPGALELSAKEIRMILTWCIASQPPELHAEEIALRERLERELLRVGPENKATPNRLRPGS